MKIIDLENASKDVLRKEKVKSTEQMIERQKEHRGREAEVRELRATVEYF
jgi:uncharacterized protein YlxW (UPF0749 family)